MQACAGFESHDICGTGAMLYQLSLQVNWGLVITLVREVMTVNKCELRFNK